LAAAPRSRAAIVAFVALILVMLSMIYPRIPASAGSGFVDDDLSTYYPAADGARWYLKGSNYVTQPPSYAVLWFQWQDSMTFLQHNGAPDGPQASSNTDQLSWWPDGYLRYVRTINSCASQTTVIDYGTTGSPIIYLPRTWQGSNWRLDGVSPAVYSVDGQVTCTGSNTWTAQILGVERMTPTEVGLHWRSIQTLNLAGSACAPVTHWQEDYWLVRDLPGPTGPTRGLKRTKGGNLDSGIGWDIWFDRLDPLPDG
jgi:hypothetical protein